MKKDLSRRLIETLVILVPPTEVYTSSQLTSLEKTIKPMLSAAELSAYNNLKPEEKSEYLSGFMANINEWKNAKYTANNPQKGQDKNDGTGGGQMPDDGLDHWQPATKTDSDDPNGQAKTGNEVFGDAEDEIEEANNKIKDSEQNGANSNNDSTNSKDPLLIANNASSIAESARQIAEAAQAAADAAQNAADLADDNARASGKESDIQAADSAQEAADKAWDLASQAKKAAQEALRAAEEAQQAADNGNKTAAGKAAKDAFNSMQEASNKAKAAQMNAKSAINNGKKTSQSNNLNDSLQGEQSGASDSEINNMSGNQAVQSAQLSASQALQAANQAQQAADNAQQKANNSGMASDQLNAKQAQQAATQALQAANQALQAAQAAQLAANNNDNASALQAAKDARDAAQDALNSRNAAQNLSKQKAGMDDKSTDPVLQQNNNEIVDPGGEFIHETPIDADPKWGGNDFFGDDDEMREMAKKIAERAGLPLTGDDLQSPSEYAGRKWVEAQKALSTWQAHPNAGKDGNPPTYIKDVMARLFASNFDWRALVEQFMVDKYPENIVDVWAKRRMGVDPSHPFYKGRYLHPNEEFEEKRSGLAQVFFLVDASGSMSVKCDDGIDIFEHIMSELIQIELAAKIKYSAYATFNTGLIDRDDIFTWTYQDASDEEDLLEQFVLPVANGGTSAVQGIQSIQEYDDVYSTSDPWTLLFIVTDGGDSYTGLSDIVNDPDQMENMIWIITATGEGWFKTKKEELMKQGIPEDHIICVDINKEWGVDESRVKRN